MRVAATRALVAFCALALAGSACSGDDTEPTTSVPTSATTIGATTAAPVTTTTTTTVATTTTTETPSITLVRSDVFVTTVGMGPIRVGMTVEEAEEAAGFALEGEPNPDVSATCYLVTPPADQPDYAGVAFMVEDGRIVRVEVRGSSSVTTRSGAGIGVTETALREMFPGRIEPAPDFVVDGVALQFVPASEVDANYRVVFVLADDVVSELRAGLLPAVGYSEGCL